MSSLGLFNTAFDRLLSAQHTLLNGKVIQRTTEVFPKQNPALAVFVGLLGFLLYEQFWYRSKKRHLPGPGFKLPIIGALFDSLNPTFEGYMAKWKSGPLSVVSVFHKFIVIASTGELSRKILLNSPQWTEPCIVDAMKHILEEDNWVFLGGKAHVDYRKMLNPMFTKRALSLYLPLLEKTYMKHFNEWLTFNGEVKQYQWLIRELNVDVSLKTFFGNYISEDVAREISRRYFDITAALQLVNFPIPLPGTQVYKAIQARKYAMKHFIAAVPMARKRMEEGGEVTCMMDEWICAMKEEEAAAVGNETKKPKNFSDREIAQVFLTFLFASQDASTSGLVWLFQLMADYPDVLDKVREEQLRIRGGDRNTPLTYEMFEQMTYTRQVVKESLRYRPPVLMLPYQTKRDYEIEPNYNVPKGAMLIATFYPALHDPEAYTNPDTFDPDRWGPNGTAEQHPKNFLVFGVGPHLCLGKEYAVMHLMCTIAQAALFMDWKHHVTEESEKISILSTIYPKDGCILNFNPRPVEASVSA